MLFFWELTFWCLVGILEVLGVEFCVDLFSVNCKFDRIYIYLGFELLWMFVGFILIMVMEGGRFVYCFIFGILICVSE